MAFAAATAAPDRQPSPGLSLNLSSNNPFRNRAATPSPLNSPYLESPPILQRPTSTNPFLDTSDMPTAANSGAANARSNTNIAVPDDIFSELSLLEKSAAKRPPQAPNGAPARSGSIPMDRNRPPGPQDRRPAPRPPRGPDSPAKRDMRPPHPGRRASDSSIREKDRRPRPDHDGDRTRDRDRGERRERTESEERRRRERRREREERHKKEKEKIRNGEKRPRKPQGLDIIDKLDVTGVYGQGLFHHDGPFDACNPHRNAKKDRRAPMQAFPAGSANMALGGAGPLNSRLDLDKFHGREAEGFSEYARTGRSATSTKVIDPLQRTEPVHGVETYGLGTSTFLEGAPASSNAVRRSSDGSAMEGGGLSRKMSLAQRFRGMSSSRRNGPDMKSPEGHYKQGSSGLDSPPGTGRIKALSAGGVARAKYTKENEINPFDNDYETAFEKKGTQIRIAEQERPTMGQPSSPRAEGFARSRTSDNNRPSQSRGSSNEEERSGGGFMSRMRSLKGGPRRPRNES